MEQIGAQGLQGLIGRQSSEQLATDKAAALKSSKLIGDTFKKEKDIRGEFSKETKTFVDINDAYGRIQASGKDPSAAGDLSLIFNYMKMLDPGSVVRESEFATAAASGSLGDRFIAVGTKILKGERLAPAQRADFMNRAGMLYNEALSGFGKRKATFEGLARSYALDPSKATYTRGLYDRYVKPEGLITEPPPPRIGEGMKDLPPGAKVRPR